MEYYLASLKFQGWLTRTSQYSSDVADAQTFSRDEAMTMIARHKEAGRQLLPVRTEDLAGPPAISSPSSYPPFGSTGRSGSDGSFATSPNSRSPSTASA